MSTFRFAIAFAAMLAGCSSTPEGPPQTDEALTEGAELSIPIADAFPRLGMQWVYDMTYDGFPPGTDRPPVLAYRLTAQDDAGHPWAGWWMYGANRGMEFTGATMKPGEVSWHPPRLLIEFGLLQGAPWPDARPATLGRRETVLKSGKEWGLPDTIKTYEDLGEEAISVPAGKFTNAWHVRGTSPGWNAEFWWRDQVGFLRMVWTHEDGRMVDMKLSSVRQVEAG